MRTPRLRVANGRTRQTKRRQLMSDDTSAAPARHAGAHSPSARTQMQLLAEEDDGIIAVAVGPGGTLYVADKDDLLADRFTPLFEPAAQDGGGDK